MNDVVRAIESSKIGHLERLGAIIHNGVAMIVPCRVYEVPVKKASTIVLSVNAMLEIEWIGPARSLFRVPGNAVWHSDRLNRDSQSARYRCYQPLSFLGLIRE